MFVGLISSLVLLFAAAPPLDLDIAPGFPGGRPCIPVRLIKVEVDGSLLLRGQPVERSRIVPSMGQVSANECERVYIQAEDGATYGAVFSLISTLRAAGFRQIALVDRPWEDPAP